MSDYEVKRTPYGCIKIYANGAPVAGFDSEIAEVLREFFQDERDTMLGRWRDPESLDHVVYESESGDYVRAVHELTGTSEKSWRYNRVVHHSAARYFAAHPEPKPWHEAKAGEVWDVKLRDGEMRRMFTHWAEGELTFIDVQGNLYDLTDPAIATAEVSGE